MRKNKIFFSLLLATLLIVFQINFSFGLSINNKYKDIDLTKTLEPDMNVKSISEYTNNSKQENDNNLVRKYINTYETTIRNIVGNSSIPSKYDLRDKIKINVENQESSNWCWAFAGLKSVETNLALKNAANYNFSEAHAAYMTSKDLGGKRYIDIEDIYDTSANFERLSEYFGTEKNSKTVGPVLETSVPNKQYTINDKNQMISASPIVKVNSIVRFPTLLVDEGEKSDTYTNYEINEVRKAIKNHIMNNGSVYATIYIPDGTTNSNMLGTNYSYCQLNADINASANHAISIVGWDDTYSKDNFKEDNRPSSDGAYICLNSWGSDWGNNGYFYVSYEDAYIEDITYGVDSVSTTYEDKEAPSVTYTKQEDGKIKVDVFDIGGSGLENGSLKYAKSSNNVQPDLNTFITFNNGDMFDMDSDYLWIYSKDIRGNDNISLIANIMFNDKNLYNAISTNKYKIFNVIDSNTTTKKVLIGNVENVSQLILISENISDISGLENFYNVNKVFLSDNNISDISVLSNLKNVELLYLAYNKISDITPIKDLINIKKLDLASNYLNEYDALENLTNLIILNLDNNGSLGDEDINIISNLTNLNELSLEETKIYANNVEKLGALENLSILNLVDTSLYNEEIDFLSNLTNLIQLDLSENEISDLSPLNNLDKLNILIAENCNIEDISTLKNLKNLEMLLLKANYIVNVSGLNVTNIKKLDLSEQTIYLPIYVQNITNQEEILPSIYKFVNDRIKNNIENATITITNATMGDVENTIIIDSTDTSKEPMIEISGGVCDGTKIIYYYQRELVDVKFTKMTENTWEKVQKVKVDVTPINLSTSLGIVEIKKLKYAWSTEKLDKYAINQSFENGAILSTPEGVSGEYYLNILAEVLDYEVMAYCKFSYGKLGVDNIKPNPPEIIGNIENNATTSDSVKLNINSPTNTLSGIKENLVSIDGGTTWTSCQNSVTIDKIGNFVLIAKSVSNTGIESDISEPFNFTITTPEIEKPTITYSTLDPTDQNVDAVITFNNPNIKIINNNGSNVYTFTKNGTFIFEYEDEQGRKGYATAVVNNINKPISNATIEYSTIDLTNQDVIATLNFENGNDGIIVTNNDGKFTHTFTENGEFTFEYQDESGNKGTCVAKVTNIDKTPPEANIIYSTQEMTNQYVTVQINFDEDGVVITNNNGDNTYVFTENGEFTFEYKDKLGNQGIYVVKVTNIDKTPPMATIIYSTEEPTKDNVEVMIKFNEENVIITNNKGFNKYIFKENGEFTFEYQDAAGNKGSTKVTVNNIDKTLAGVSKLPDTGFHIAIIFTVILILIARFVVANKDKLEKVWILYKNRREFDNEKK